MKLHHRCAKCTVALHTDELLHISQICTQLNFILYSRLSELGHFLIITIVIVIAFPK